MSGSRSSALKQWSSRRVVYFVQGNEQLLHLCLFLINPTGVQLFAGSSYPAVVKDLSASGRGRLRRGHTHTHTNSWTSFLRTDTGSWRV